MTIAARTPPQTLEEALAIISEQALKITEQEQLIATLLQRIQALEERLNTHSRNSSKPPSSDPPSAPPKTHKTKGGKKSGRKRGGQPGRQGKGRTLLPPDQVDRTVECRPDTQCRCGAEAHINKHYRRHQVFELPQVRPEVTEYRLYQGTCPRCSRTCRGELPTGVGMSQLGPRAHAMIATLSGAYRQSKRLIKELLKDVYGLDISIGAISDAERRVSEALRPCEDEARAHVKAASRVHCDETGHFCEGQRGWVWVAVTRLISLFHVATSRSTEVARKILGETFSGILISDRYCAYNWVDSQARQLCWAHLKRDFQKMVDRGGTSKPIGEALLAQTEALFKSWHQVRDGTLEHA